MKDQRIKVGQTIPIEAKGFKQMRLTLKEYILDEWRAMGYDGLDQYREGVRLVWEPVNTKEAT